MANFGSFFCLCIRVGVRKRLECREIGFPERCRREMRFAGEAAMRFFDSEFLVFVPNFITLRHDRKNPKKTK